MSRRRNPSRGSTRGSTSSNHIAAVRSRERELSSFKNAQLRAIIIELGLNELPTRAKKADLVQTIHRNIFGDENTQDDDAVAPFPVSVAVVPSASASASTPALLTPAARTPTPAQGGNKTPRSKSRGRQTTDKYTKTPSGHLQRSCSDIMELSTNEEHAIRSSGLSHMQFERSLNFIDVSGDGEVSRVELRGGLMAAGMINREVKTVVSMFFATENDKSIRLDELKRKALDYLLLANSQNHRNERKKGLMKKTLNLFLNQWEDKLSVFKWKRVFQGTACFLFPLPFAILPHKIQPFGIGNHTDSVYIPATFRNSEEQIWSSERRRVLFECLETLTTHENINFDLTSIIFRVVLKDEHGEKLAEDILIRLAFRREEDTESGKQTKIIRVGNKELKLNTIRVGEEEVQCKQSKHFVQKWLRKLVIANNDDMGWLAEPDYGYSYKYKEVLSPATLDEQFIDKMQDEINILFNEKMRDPQYIEQIRNDKIKEREHADDDDDDNDPDGDDEEDPDTSWTSKQAMSRQESVYSNDEKIPDPIEDLYLKQNQQINAEVGVWELRLRCKEDSSLRSRGSMNPLVGTEVVYQHESQTLEVQEPPTTRELHENESWGPNQDAVEHSRQLLKNILEHTQTSVRGVLWNRMIIYHVALFCSVVFLFLLWWWERYTWSKQQYECKSTKDQCCWEREVLISVVEVSQVIFFYVVLGVLGAYKNGWQQSEHKNYIMDRTQNAEQEAYLFKAIAENENRNGCYHKSFGSIFSRLVALIIAAFPMMGKYLYMENFWRDTEALDLDATNTTCKPPSMSIFTGKTDVVGYQGLAKWPQTDQIAAGFSLLGIVGVFASILMQVCTERPDQLACASCKLNFKQIYFVVMLLLAACSMSLANENENYSAIIYVAVIPCLLVIIATVVWGSIRTLDRTHGKFAALLDALKLKNFVDRFVGFRFRKEYHEVLAVVAPPMIGICMIMYQSISFREHFPTLARYMINEQFEISTPQRSPKSLRLVVHWSCFALCYTLCRVWLDVMHANYRYFENQTRVLELFTKASSATSWHSFKRDFIQQSNKSTKLSPVLSKLREALRVKEHFDLLVLENLASWDDTRNVLAKEWTSNETLVRESNLHLATLQMLFFSFLVLIRIFNEIRNGSAEGSNERSTRSSATPRPADVVSALLTALNVSFNMTDQSQSSNKPEGSDFVQKIAETSNTTHQQFMLLVFVSLLVVVPMLYTRNKLGSFQNEHVKLLEKIQHRTNIIEIHKKIDSENDEASKLDDLDEMLGDDELMGSMDSDTDGGDSRGSRRRSPSVGRLGRRPKWKRLLGLEDYFGTSSVSSAERRGLREVESDDVEKYLNKIQQSDRKPEIFPGNTVEDILPIITPIIMSIIGKVLWDFGKCSNLFFFLPSFYYTTRLFSFTFHSHFIFSRVPFLLLFFS